MRPDEERTVGHALGAEVVRVRALAGGFSHETALVTLAGGRRVVVRLGGTDPRVEAAVMAAAGRHVPVPRVLHALGAGGGARAMMILDHVRGSVLGDVLAGRAGAARPAGRAGDVGLGDLGAEVGQVIATIGRVGFERPGFFADATLAVAAQPPWSAQLPEFAATCMADTPAERLDPATARAWERLCTAHAPRLSAVEHHARLAHADVNPKNILVDVAAGRWRVTAVLDWEFSHSGCPYGDAANMLRFAASYPARFRAGFRAGFAAHQPTDLPLVEDWRYLGRVLDMFALSDLATRPPGHRIADQAAALIRAWLGHGVPDAPE